MIASTNITNAQLARQKVGTNPTLINPSAVLEADSPDKGILFPRVANTAAITAPTNGLVIYDLSSNCLKVYENNAWSDCLSATSSSGSSSAQAVISNCNNTGINCLGTSLIVVMTNNSFSTAGPISFAVSDVVLSGLTGYAVTAVSPTSASIAPGASQTITYTITKTNGGDGILTALWTKLGLSCSTTKALGGNVAGLGSTMTVQNGLATTTSTHSGTNYTAASYSTGQNFSENTICANKYISAGYTAATCTGAVTGESGKVYDLVFINGQCWMKQNCVEVPSNYVTVPVAGSTDNGWHGFQNNNPSNASLGRYYTWSAAMNVPVGGCAPERSRGVCPEGFHIPSDCEWQYLEHGMGMSISQQNLLTIRSSALNQGTVAYKLKSEGTGFTNASGLSLVNVGFMSGGSFVGVGINNHYRVSTEYLGNAMDRHFDSSGSNFDRFSYSKALGFAVRCIKD